MEIRRQASAILSEIRQWESSLSDPRHLQHWENSSWSQNGEDGILDEALKRLEITRPIFVEFGAGDGSENCTRALLERDGSGLWLEGDSRLVDKAQVQFQHFPIDVMCAFLTKENIIESIQNSIRVRNGFDLLVVDVDGNDWWLLKEILQHFSPSLIVTEYNPFYGPIKKWVMPYRASHSWQHDNYYGASLKSYAKLLQRFGYVLVACDSSAVNAFWVKASSRELFTSQKNASNLFVPALPGMRHRHRHDSQLEEELSETDLNQIKIEFIEVFQDTKTQRKLVCAQVTNDSSKIISPFGKYPIRVGISSEANLPQTGRRLYFDRSVTAGASGLAWGVFEIDFDWTFGAVVQEGVRWGITHRL